MCDLEVEAGLRIAPLVGHRMDLPLPHQQVLLVPDLHLDAAVAGISSPPLDRRSPSSSGRRTRTRSDIIVTALAAARSGTERIDRFATEPRIRRGRVQFAGGHDGA